MVGGAVGVVGVVEGVVAGAVVGGRVGGFVVTSGWVGGCMGA